MVSTNLTHKCVATGSKLTESFPVVFVFNIIQISFIGERLNLLISDIEPTYISLETYVTSSLF